MTRKHYAFIARCFRMQLHMAESNSRRTAELARMCRFFAMELEAEFPNFERTKFMAAVGFPEE